MSFPLNSPSAIANGADRLEVCSNLAFGGGTSGSMGLVRVITDVFPSVPLMVMVRPRVGSFVYLPDEVLTMVAEIEQLQVFADQRWAADKGGTGSGRQRKGGVQGVVVGALRPDGVDTATMARLIKAAGKHLSITFHRAFDMVLDQAQAYEDILSLDGRITRILTSAGSRNFGAVGVMKNMKDLINIQLESLCKVTIPPRDHPILMPGSGVRPEVLPWLLDMLLPIWKAFKHRWRLEALETDERSVLGEVHLSGGCWYVPGPEESDHVTVSARKKGMGFGLAAGPSGDEESKNWGRWRVVGEKVAAVRSTVDQYCNVNCP